MSHTDTIPFQGFYEAWNWLHKHPYYYAHSFGRDAHLFSCFTQCTDIFVVAVNPDTNEIDDREELNTQTQVWLETGKMECVEGPANKKSWRRTHDWELDCGGDTYEEAIIQLAHKVLDREGDYEEDY